MPITIRSDLDRIGLYYTLKLIAQPWTEADNRTTCPVCALLDGRPLYIHRSIIQAPRIQFLLISTGRVARPQALGGGHFSSIKSRICAARSIALLTAISAQNS